MNKTIIYTIITGNYDSVKQPLDFQFVDVVVGNDNFVEVMRHYTSALQKIKNIFNFLWNYFGNQRNFYIFAPLY
jgi:hypothetical protein